MLQNRLAAARMVAEKLAASETAIDDALISMAELTAVTPMAQRRANVSPTVVQDAMALTGEATAALQEARAKLMAAHQAFAEVRDQIGLRVHAGGDLWKLVPPKTAQNEDRVAA